MKLLTLLSALLLLLPTALADGSLLAKIRLDITKALEQPKYWDERIPLITDNNYQDIIVNESLTDEEQHARTWAIIITATANDSLDSLSKMMDRMFDAAYNETVVAGDIPHVRWGRIDYLNVTYLTTKWNIWSAPYLLILRNRGQELRFYRGQHLRLRESDLRDFLRAGDWKHTPPWSSSLSPGGDREFIMHFFAMAMTKAYNLTVKIPRWLFVLLSGAAGSALLSLMHAPAAPRPRQRATRELASPEQVEGTTSISGSSMTDGDNAKKRKRR
ncbi:hypothetical protein APHAL10511_001578 [Amanita phalloides]|nr:hypothetical protein APHAL10511_001578 [Amanita phalloides]